MIAKRLNLTIVRGDSATIGVRFNGLETEPDSIYFSVKRNYSDTEYKLQKTIGDGIEKEESEGMRYKIKMTPEDTGKLYSGDYVYDVELTIGDTRVTPVIGNFCVVPDVTRH